MERHYFGNDDHGISRHKFIVTSGDNYLSVTEYRSNKDIFLETELAEGYPHNGRLLLDDELCRLYLVLDDAVKGLNVAADGVFHRPDIADDAFGGNVLGINYSVKVKLIYHLVKVDTVYLGDELALALVFGKKGK